MCKLRSVIEIDMDKAVPLWKWILLFILAFVLGVAGYWLLQSLAGLVNNPILTFLGFFSLPVRPVIVFIN